MNNKELYPEFVLIPPTLNYAILFSTGTGVMEDPINEVGYICQSNDYKEIRGMSERLQLAFNGFYDKHESWQYFNFAIHSKNNQYT